MEGAQDPKTRREILNNWTVNQLEPSRHALGLAGRDRDGSIREEAVEDLRHFVDDPQAESLLGNYSHGS